MRGSYYAARNLIAQLLLVLTVLLLVASGAYAEPKFPPLTGRIVDDAHLLTPADKASIEADLKALDAKSSDQLVVYTTNSLQGYPIADFGYQLGRAWGIGQKGTNNGVILIVAPTERKVRIEVGRGLEPQLTDLLSTLIIQNRILPEFRRGQFSAGVKAGVHDIKDVLLGDAEAVKQRAAARPIAARKGQGWEELIPLIFIVGIFIFVLWAQSQQARQPLAGGRYRRSGYSGPIFFPGGWGGGGGGGGGGGDGGGFSGGGGDFGGGGASGDW
ncbi:MAG: TPM domain-containing protein [Rhodomicrobium sp.]